MNASNQPYPQQHQHAQIQRKQYLQREGWPSGLINALVNHASRFPLRVLVIDNSGSMQAPDAHIVQGSTTTGIHKVACTRWQEAQQSLNFFCQMAATLSLPTRFTMLNDLERMIGPSHFSIAERGPENIAQDLQNAYSIIQQAYPSGATPLTQHVEGVRQLVMTMADSLRREGKTISVILATDGIPSDKDGNEGYIIQQQFSAALKRLEGLPVWVIIRLCTDDDSVFDYYNSLESQINLPYDVLDDYYGEALEVYLQNPWLTYALPLHRFREMGFYIPAFDEMDEHQLSYRQLFQLVSFLFEQGSRLPDPERDWRGFLYGTAQMMMHETLHYNPILNTQTPLLDLRRLQSTYGQGMFPRDLSHIPVFPSPQTDMAYMHAQQQRSRPASSSTNMGARNGASGSRQNASGMHHDYTTAPQQNGNGQQAPAQTNFSRPNGVPAVNHVNTALKHNIIRWAVAGNQLRPIDQILSSMQQTFPPTFSVAPHPYFQKWKPITQQVLKERTFSLIKRAYRKAKFFLHPDKLPRDFSPDQALVCELLWSILADAWEVYQQTLN